MVATQEQRLLDAETRRVHDDLAAASRRAIAYGLNSMTAKPWRPKSESAPGPLERRDEKTEGRAVKRFGQRVAYCSRCDRNL